MSVCLSVFLSVCLSLSLFVCLFVCLSVCPSVWLESQVDEKNCVVEQKTHLTFDPT